VANRSILITGASKGIGRALTDRLTSRGYQVIGIARNADPTFPGELIEVDLADPAATAGALRDIVARRSIYGVVNNVGLARPQPLGAVGLADLAAVLDLNLRPALQAVQAAPPVCKRPALGES